MFATETIYWWCPHVWILFIMTSLWTQKGYATSTPSVLFRMSTAALIDSRNPSTGFDSFFVSIRDFRHLCERLYGLGDFSFQGASRSRGYLLGALVSVSCSLHPSIHPPHRLHLMVLWCWKAPWTLINHRDRHFVYRSLTKHRLINGWHPLILPGCTVANEQVVELLLKFCNETLVTLD